MLRKAFVFAVVLAVPALATASETLAFDQAQRNQRARIEQGVASGELTVPETLHLARQQVRLHRHTSRSVYRQKHDGQKRGR